MLAHSLRRIGRPLGRVGAMLILLLALQVLWAGFGFLLNGDLSYMGATDTGLIDLGLSLYRVDIVRTVASLVVYNWVTWVILLAPVIGAMLGRRAGTARGRIGHTAWLIGAVIIVTYLWIGWAAMLSPSLFAEVYYGDGSRWTARPFTWICSRSGPWVLGGVMIFVALAYGRRFGRRPLAGAVAYYIALAALLALSSPGVGGLRLPPRSVTLLMVDSLRTDFLTPEHAPVISAFYAHYAGPKTRFNHVTPIIPRTLPSINTLLTGKLPRVSGVTTMFPPAYAFDQTDSVVRRYRAAGYCTIAVAEYPGEFFRKMDYGFELVDAPEVRFKEILLQMLIKKNPLALATARWRPLRRWPRVHNLVEGLPEFAQPGALFASLREQVAHCGERPVFAFLFFDQPHFPYVQTWPHYLAAGAGYTGPYRYLKDAVSSPQNLADKLRVRDLYAASLRSSDQAIGEFLDHLAKTQDLSQQTIVISGDHGESLYDATAALRASAATAAAAAAANVGTSLDVMGHGDQIADPAGVEVPWIVLDADAGRLRGRENQPLSQLHLTQWLADLRGLGAELAAPPLALDEVYLETELWMAETPNVPHDRIHYPDLAGLLEVESPDAHMSLKPHLLPWVEYAKFRSLRTRAGQLDVTPLPTGLGFSRDHVAIRARELRPRERALLSAQDPWLARQLHD